MKKYVILVFVITSMICFPKNIYAHETIDIENYEKYNNLYFALIDHTDEVQFPETLTMYATDGNTYTESIIWDESNINWQEEGYYSIKGTISNAEKYNNIPNLSINVKIFEKYDMYLQADTVTHDSVTFSFQDSFSDKEHELDLTRLHVWACEARQYFQDKNWYDVTDHQNVHLTPTSLTIDSLESIYGTDYIYCIQISYDDPFYYKYSLTTTIFADEDKLYAMMLCDGDRNGGNREKRNEVVIPDEDIPNNDNNKNDDITNNSDTSIDNQVPTIDNENILTEIPSVKEPLSIEIPKKEEIVNLPTQPKNEQNIISKENTQPIISNEDNHPSIVFNEKEVSHKTKDEIKVENTKTNITIKPQDNKMNTVSQQTNHSSKKIEIIQKNIKQIQKQSQSTHINKSNHSTTSLQQNDLTSKHKENIHNQITNKDQTTNKERTIISAQSVEIYSTPSLLMPLFIIIGIIMGGITIKKTYEEK